MGVIERERAQRRFDTYSLGADDSVAMLDDAQELLARRPLLANAIATPVATPEMLAIIMLNLDHIKHVNDESTVPRRRSQRAAAL